MDHKPTELYIAGGITAFLSGILMLVANYLVMFPLQAAYQGTPEQQMEFIASQPLTGITHGLSVVSLILIVPTIAALFVLLNTIVTARSYVGIGFAIVWIVVAMVGHLSQTAPLRALSELYNDPATRETAMSIYHVWEEFGEALLLTGTFFSALTAFCYGLAFIDDWNRLSGYLFLLAILAFPLGLLIPGIRGHAVQAHVVLRGLAFLIVGVVLIKIAMTEET